MKVNFYDSQHKKKTISLKLSPNFIKKSILTQLQYETSVKSANVKPVIIDINFFHIVLF